MLEIAFGQVKRKLGIAMGAANPDTLAKDRTPGGRLRGREARQAPEWDSL